MKKFISVTFLVHINWFWSNQERQNCVYHLHCKCGRSAWECCMEGAYYGAWLRSANLKSMFLILWIWEQSLVSLSILCFWGQQTCRQHNCLELRIKA